VTIALVPALSDGPGTPPRCIALSAGITGILTEVAWRVNDEIGPVAMRD
jgi:hypothetical protein